MYKPKQPIINEILDDIQDIIQYEKLDDMNVENLRIYIRKLETQISDMQWLINRLGFYICQDEHIPKECHRQFKFFNKYYQIKETEEQE